MTTTNTLQTKVLRKSNGARLANGDTVWVRYEGKLLNGTPFDANYNFTTFSSAPNRTLFDFQLGLGQVIQGWDQGLLNRQVGEVLELTIPANLAYGTRGAGAQIPPNATLRFQVEIVAKLTPGSSAITALQPLTDFGVDASAFQQQLGQIQAYKAGLDLADTLSGSALRDLLLGLEGDDTLQGGNEADILVAGKGNDQLDGGLGNDFLDGGEGLDTVWYGAANNTINLAVIGPQATGEGSDTLKGIENINAGAGDDLISGNQERNTLIGGAGKDVLNGGDLQDRLSGGTDADQFVYTLLSQSPAGIANRDIITDFNGALGDRIDLSFLDASSTVPGNQAFTYIGSLPFSGKPGQVRFAIDLLQINSDADKLANMEIELTGVTSFLSSHFIP